MNNGKVWFWMCVVFAVLNGVGYLTSGSIFSLVVCLINVYAAYTLRNNV